MASARNGPVWYLAQIKPNCSQIAQRNLARQGFEVFIPLERQTRRRQGGFVLQDVPFFPGYLFVTPGPVTPLRAINSTQGISRLVSFGGGPAPVPSAVITGLRSRCDADGCLIPQDTLSSGDRVRVAAGPFTDILAEIMATAPDRRVWVLLDFMGSPTRIAMNADDLRAV